METSIRELLNSLSLDEFDQFYRHYLNAVYPSAPTNRVPKFTPYTKSNSTNDIVHNCIASADTNAKVRHICNEMISNRPETKRANLPHKLKHSTSKLTKKVYITISAMIVIVVSGILSDVGSDIKSWISKRFSHSTDAAPSLPAKDAQYGPADITNFDPHKSATTSKPATTQPTTQQSTTQETKAPQVATTQSSQKHHGDGDRISKTLTPGGGGVAEMTQKEREEYNKAMAEVQQVLKDLALDTQNKAAAFAKQRLDGLLLSLKGLNDSDRCDTIISGVISINARFDASYLVAMMQGMKDDYYMTKTIKFVAAYLVYPINPKTQEALAGLVKDSYYKSQSIKALTPY